MLQKEFHATRAEVGVIASYSTVAYAAGKFIFGSVVDRIGGRAGFFASLLCVALMGVAGGFAPTLGMLAIFYSLNRFAGAAGWPSMVKLTPDWFPKKQLPFALAVLSLSFVIGGACATLFAGQVAKWSDNNWRMVMMAPSFVLLFFVLINWWLLPSPSSTGAAQANKKREPFSWENYRILFRIRQFWLICSMSFVLTLLRETFNTWTVDFIKTEGGAEVSNRIAAFLSTPYDVLGAAGILFVGWIYGRLSNRARKWLLCSMLMLLAIFLFALPSLFKLGLGAVTIALGLIGFLIYGPYSLLAGALSVEVRGKEYVASVSGMVDGTGYFAGILAGSAVGRIVDIGGYSLAFKTLGGLAIVAAILCYTLFEFLSQRADQSANVSKA